LNLYRAMHYRCLKNCGQMIKNWVGLFERW